MYDKGLVMKFGGTSVVSAVQDDRVINHAVNVYKENVSNGGSVVVVTSGIGAIGDGEKDNRKVTDLMVDICGGLNEAHNWNVARERYFENIQQHGMDVSLLDDLVFGVESILESGSIDAPAHAILTGFPEMAKRIILSNRAKYLHPDVDFKDTRGITGMVGKPGFGYTNVVIDHQMSLESIKNRSAVCSLDGSISFQEGFVGILPGGTSITLERGSSDATATYFAAAMGLDEVIIYSDHPGISPVDPRIVPGLKAITEVSAREGTVFSGMGAKIIQSVAIRPADDMRIPIWVKDSGDLDGNGTYVGVCNPSLDHYGVKAIAFDPNYAFFLVKGMDMSRTGVAANVQGKFAKHGFSIAYEPDGDDCRPYLIKLAPGLHSLLEDLATDGLETEMLSYPCARLALVGEGMSLYDQLHSGDNAYTIFTRVLRENDIPDLGYSRVKGAVSISTVIPQKFGDLALTKLSESLGFK